MLNLARLVASISVLIGAPIGIVNIARLGGFSAHPIVLAMLVLSVAVAGGTLIYFDHFLRQRGLAAIEGSLEKIASSDFESSEVAAQDRGWTKTIFAAIAKIAQARENDVRLAKEFAIERSASAQRKAAADAEAQRYVEAHNFFMSAFIDALQGLANGRLTQQLEQPFSPDYEKLRFCYNETIERLGLALAHIVVHIESVKGRTEDLNRAADALASRTYQQAANLEETSAALKEIATTVQKTATGAQHASGVVSEARSDAEKSAEIVKQAIDAMGRIEKSSQEIGKIIGVIDEIAFQTNLLALNAGVEAARAGDAGKGFSVVASEVRALAQRSAEAAREIKGLITTSTAHVHEGVQLVANTGNALERIMERVSEGTRVVAVIASDAKDQANSLGEASAAIAQMDQFTQQNATLVEQANTICRGLGNDIADMTKAVAPFDFPRRTALALSAPKQTPVTPKPGVAMTRRAGAAATPAIAVKHEEDPDQGWEEF